MDLEIARNLTLLITFLTAAPLLLLMVPVGTCDRCPHCRNERLRGSRIVDGAYSCPLCRKRVGPDERHEH